MGEPIYRTVYQVEVFSEGPLDIDGGPDDPFDLGAISDAITYGDCIGNITQVSQEVVPPADVEAYLLRIGNDGTFFQSDEDESEGEDW